MSNQTNFKKRGFTLVEMLVAIAVFSIVMVVAMSALINVIDANRKAQSIKIAINNVNVALEGISKDMRMGMDYKCLNNLGQEEPCSRVNGNLGVKYVSSKNVITSYWLDGLIIKKKIGSERETEITSQEVRITNMKFYVLGVDDSGAEIGSKTQPRVIITLTGEAGLKESSKTVFDLQTSVSQRYRVKIN